MTFTEKMLEKARQNRKSITLPEATNEKVLLAAAKLVELGAAQPVLVGNPDEIKAAAADCGVDLTALPVVDTTDEAFLSELKRDFLALSSEFSEKALGRRFRDPMNVAAAMVRTGRADCLAAGIVHTTGEVILAAQMFIGTKPGISVISSIGMVEFPNYTTSEGNMICFADCAVNAKPSSEELADIALASADTVSMLLGWEPRVALLSFSTKGSSEHEEVDRVRAAVEIARERRPELAIDGEFQLDAAIIPAVAAKKVKEASPVAGKANVVIFPDLGAGNISVKMVQIFAGATAHGPLLQGFARPVTDFSRSAPVEEIVGNLVMLAVTAQ